MKKLTLTTAIALATSLCASSVMADNYAYAEGRDGPFGTIDLNTGVFTSLGTMNEFLSGLGVANGRLFGASFIGDAPVGTLYTVNPANGNLTAVGSSGISYEDIGSTPGGLYAVGSDLNLYSINPTTGAATLVGATHLSALSGYFGMSAGSSTLYVSSGPNLYSLSTSTGLATLVGNMGGPQMGALLQEGGLLYGGEDTTVAVDTLNPSTGLPTTGPSVTGPFNDFWGLAPEPIPSSAPDGTPTISLLAAVCIGGLLLRRRALTGCA